MKPSTTTTRVRGSYNHSIKSERLVSCLVQAGIQPKLFAQFLKHTIKNKATIQPANPKQKFEFGLCCLQAEMIILLVDP